MEPGELEGVEGAVLGSCFEIGVTARVDLDLVGVEGHTEGAYEPQVAVECEVIMDTFARGNETSDELVLDNV